MKLLNDNVVLKNGLPAKIFQIDALQSFPGVSLVLRTYADLVDDGFNIGYNIGVNNETSVIWAEIDKKIVGGICYILQKQLKQIWISLSFTDKNYRCLGINYHCHYALEDLAKELEIRSIASHVSVNNTSRIESCKKVGMMPKFYRMQKKIL